MEVVVVELEVIENLIRYFRLLYSKSFSNSNSFTSFKTSISNYSRWWWSRRIRSSSSWSGNSWFKFNFFNNYINRWWRSWS
jgi:hypothetical protein